ncbi:MAG: uroporphyrinogen decarboxylase [Chloroflexi bacterium]|nr:uroporphyrinogen decarboxylase [Chloroflexota bacterium]
MNAMSKSERLRAAFVGEEVDRPPVALWRHWPGDDRRAEDLARDHVHFQRRYDFDFIKVTPSSSYCVEDWGVLDVYLGSLEGTCEYRRHAVASPEDWEHLPVLDPGRGALHRQLRSLELIAAQVGDEVPFIQTVFNPLSMAKYLAGEERMLVHLRRYPEALRKGLETVTETSIRFVREVMRTGAAGLFFAVQHAQYGLLSEDEYKAFGRPYDLRVLEAAEGAWFNLLHLHGSQVMFDLLADYPVRVVNWHDRETPPTLAEGQKRFPGAVCGGLRQWETMVRGTPADVRAEALDAIAQTGGRRFILGTGCVTPIVAPLSNLDAARQAVEPVGAL